jgi:hypothetical protein
VTHARVAVDEVINPCGGGDGGHLIGLTSVVSNK